MIAIKYPILTKTDRKDALSFLGYRNYPKEKPDESILLLLDKYEKILLSSIRPRYAYKISERETVLETGLLAGNDIKEHTDGCDSVVLMCVTLGLEADRLIVKTSVSDVTASVIIDALAGALVEQLCNICVDDIKSVFLPKFPLTALTPRFSPGYGDFPIGIQSGFLSELDSGRKIGLHVNENNILIPRKSVTAVIGIKI